MNKQASQITRKKRAAPFNFVGWIGHELFGIMDATRARMIERKIYDVKSKQNYFMELARNQTSIVELTVNLVKSTHEEVTKGMGLLSNALATLKNETDIIRRKEQILGWAMYTSLLISRVERIQRNIINMLTDLQQGHVSSYLFTPHQFKQQLNMINDHIPAGSKLPLDPQHDMRSFYEIMRGRMRVTEQNILLEITLPLVSIAEFQVFYLIPVPFQHNGEHMSIIPDSKYLLINLQRDIFYQMDDHDLDECMKPQGAPIICQSKRPINNIQSSGSRCERELLAKHMEFSSQCRINITNPRESWIQLKEKNMWIYAVIILFQFALVNLILRDKMKMILKQLEQIPTMISWHCDSALLVIANERCQFQCFDISLACVKNQLISEDMTPSNLLDLSSYFTTQPTLVNICWSKKPDLALHNDGYTQSDCYLLLCFENGPMACLRFFSGTGLKGDVHTSGFTADVLIQQYLNLNHIEKAINLLLCLNWDTYGAMCLMSTETFMF